jgi:hypothetical protein
MENLLTPKEIGKMRFLVEKPPFWAERVFPSSITLKKIKLLIIFYTDIWWYNS